MEFGRREKMVAGGIAAAALMASLHFFLFGPRVTAWKAAAQARDDKKNAASAIKVAKQQDINDLTSRTTVSLDMLTSGVETLGMGQHPAFIMPDFANTKPEDLPALQAKAKQLVNDEIVLVLDEVKKLQKAALDASAAGNTRLSFLNAPTPPTGYGQPQPQGWALPIRLPDQMTRDPNALLDAIKTIAEYKNALDTMPPESDAYLQSRANYYAEMNQKLGIDYFYIQGNNATTNRQLMNSQPWPGWPGVANFGEFVPLIDKLALANLIMEQVARYETPKPNGTVQFAVIPGSGRLTRDVVFKIVDIDVVDIGNIIDGMKENKLYFLYEELRNVNMLVKMALDQQLTDVTYVGLDGYSYLKQWTGTPGQASEVPKTLDKLMAGTQAFPYQSDELTIGESGASASSAAVEEDEGEINYEMEGMDGEGGPGGGAPGEGGAPGAAAAPAAKAKVNPNSPVETEEIGIALPIKVVYQGTNNKIWKYIYDVLRKQPMTELQRMSFRTMSQMPGQENNQNVEGTVTFVIVPKMFSVVDDVRKQLEQIKSAPTSAPDAENNPS